MLLGNAAALLHPISFEEPFGLSVAEAMMCGTPVIAFAKGSMPELIVNGVTGFVVDDVPGAVAAIKRLNEISPFACHKHALKNFSRTRMARDYMEVYESILNKTSVPT